MKILKRIATGFAIVLVLFILVGLTRRRGWHVERSVVVAAKPATISALVANLRAWQDWATWNKAMDPDAQWTYAGPAQGAGAMTQWKGKKLGEGTMQITSADEKSVHYVMTLAGGYPAHGVFTFEPGASRTKVVWDSEGDMKMNLLARYLIPTMEDAIGKQFDDSLEHLKGLAEKQEGTTPAAAAPVAVPAVAK